MAAIGGFRSDLSITRKTDGNFGTFPRVFCFPKLRINENGGKDNYDNSLHLGRKYARISVSGHYLFLEAHSFSRATLSENCSLLGTDNVRGQISWHSFAPNGGYCLFSIYHTNE